MRATRRKYTNLKDKMPASWRERQVDPGRPGIEGRETKKQITPIAT
jgi:hypothetical protein